MIASGVVVYVSCQPVDFRNPISSERMKGILST
ncbi:hypothetical protein N434_04648 [Rhizobium sp. UGM030330-04]|nr:hypothetical protein N434_04648 [Rhizobium sp. UGM030330-04]